MRLSATKPVRPCTSSNPTSRHFACTITNSKNNLNTNTRPPINLENLFVDYDLRTTSSSWLVDPAPMTTLSSVKLNKRWMDYQGLKNWEGLLDPLDDNLRCEIIRYGRFVEAAYRSCNFDPSSPSYGMCRYSKRKLLEESGFPETGYRVTKNLMATSGIQLPGWAERGPTWMAMQSSWIGYVAVCQDRKEISRLGRRDVVIAFRGTATGLEWLENLRATLTPLPNGDCNWNCYSDSDCEPMVESGFLSLYTSNDGNRPSLQTLVREEIARILEKHGDEALSFTITGHSLGAALATLAAYDIKQTFKNSPLVTVISFAGPRVGNWSFRCQLEEQGTKVLRIVNSDDLITKIPGFVIDNNENHQFLKHSGSYTEAASANLAGWVQKLVEDTQWVYADVGCELRLSSRDSPDLNSINIAACHELKTYLHLVNEFVGSNCPFRATARKMMNKT
ncbi:phospholipase A(1) DAD1, chloroplastic-like [Sesamum indicum]|uniref:Phospholipase A(1) DAD1, chloroplastic-like n=1 Tax=Sesamum indicum TaxID=4182 RepID=A0A6I9U5C2_SESIN|nr:phospholipase A(1) DAD1, chloroplastic-like [Sesamum indicum]